MLAGQLLRPGLFAQVELELSSIAGTAAEPVLAVPEDAVQTVEGREAVFIPADEPNTFTPVPLTLGRRVGHYYPVLSGLKEGDSYVAKGSFLLKAELGKEGAAHEH
jgi:cobalt-zinc-cadmium efflux system membrane fusion protein